MPKPIVYFTREITPESLVKIYHKLDKKLKGKIGVKFSTQIGLGSRDYELVELDNE